MFTPDRSTVKVFCYIISIPLGILAFKLFMISLPYLCMLGFAFIIGTSFQYYFDKYQ